MPLPRRARILHAVVALAVAVPSLAGAQDSTRGVRIGLRYDPSTKPGILVLPVSGSYGDSVRAILERDLDYSDRFSVIALSSSDAQLLRGQSPSGASAPLNFPLLAKLGAAAVVQATPTATGLHVVLHDVGRTQVGTVEDFRLPKPELTREWRQAVHGV